MLNGVYYFITVPMVYLAIAWCLVGVAIKIAGQAKAPKHPFSLKIYPDKNTKVPSTVWGSLAMPTIRRQSPTFWFFLVIFHLGLVVLLLSHLDLLPWFNIYPEDSKHMLGNGAAGVAVVASGLYFLVRRFKGPLREISVPADYLLLLLIFAVFITGAVISWSNSWNPDGFVLTKQDFGAYLDSLTGFTFENPAEIMQGSHYIVIVVHVLLANLLLLVLPFSKMMHSVFAFPANAIRRG